MARIAAAIKPGNDIAIPRQHIDDPAFALVTALLSKYATYFHQIMVLNYPWYFNPSYFMSDMRKCMETPTNGCFRSTR